MVQEILVVVLAILYIVGLVLAVLITLIIVMLLIPFGFEVLATRDAETRVDLRVLLANIRVYSFRVWPSKKTASKAKTVKKRATRAGTRKAGRPAAASRILSGLSLDLFAQVVRLLQRLWRSLRLRVSASGRFGASDPATTGMIYGAYQAAIRPFNITETLRPCFDRPCLEGRVEVTGRVWPIQLIVDAALFVFSKPVRQVWFPELRYLVSRR